MSTSDEQIINRNLFSLLRIIKNNEILLAQLSTRFLSAYILKRVFDLLNYFHVFKNNIQHSVFRKSMKGRKLFFGNSLCQLLTNKKLTDINFLCIGSFKECNAISIIIYSYFKYKCIKRNVSHTKLFSLLQKEKVACNISDIDGSG